MSACKQSNFEELIQPSAADVAPYMKGRRVLVQTGELRFEIYKRETERLIESAALSKRNYVVVEVHERTIVIVVNEHSEHG